MPPPDKPLEVLVTGRVEPSVYGHPPDTFDAAKKCHELELQIVLLRRDLVETQARLTRLERQEARATSDKVLVPAPANADNRA